jgi:integrase
VKRDLVAVLNDGLQVTVGGALERYERYMREDKGNRKSSVRTTMIRLSSFFPEHDMLIKGLTEAKGERYYAAARKRATDTSRNTLAEAKTFGRWCVKRKYLKSSPLETIEPQGKRRRGKAQLRPQEARAFMALALERSSHGNDGAFASASCLGLGTRQNAITLRLVRDVDPVTRTLYVRGDKTRAGDRQLEIPEMLWPHFEARIEGRGPMEHLLPAPDSRDGFHHKDWVNKNTQRLCRELGIPVVTAQGLRGTHATLAEDAGVSAHTVAAQLGHESITTTHGHYTRPEAVERSQQRRALAKLNVGGKPPLQGG